MRASHNLIGLGRASAKPKQLRNYLGQSIHEFLYFCEFCNFHETEFVLTAVYAFSIFYQQLLILFDSFKLFRIDQITVTLSLEEKHNKCSSCIL